VRIPRPRTPLADSLRRLLPKPEAPEEIDVPTACADLAEVAVRTSAHGSWQENACFLLGSAGGTWRMVPFSHPAVAELVIRLRALPCFDDNDLLDVIGSREERVVVLWRHPGRSGFDHRSSG
jgi:hypothetical protein